jgi:hypothetical protein
VRVFDEHPPFSRYGQLEFHRETISMRRKIGSAVSAIGDPAYIESLLRTLRAWQIVVRASVLVSDEVFQAELASHSAVIAELDNRSIEDGDSLEVQDAAWELVDSLRITENEAKLVAHTKALHHLMPDLFVPIDRAFTGSFFGWHPNEFQFDQEHIFRSCWSAFSEVAREAQPSRLVDGQNWRTSQTKLIDNAIVGYCMREGLSKEPRQVAASSGEPRGDNWSLNDLGQELASFEAELREAGLAGWLGNTSHGVQTSSGFE